ncbi:MAG: hypothetical protein IJ214_12900, partial [Clostridia bacterium]|nr:hypothetical protein [Clostridia bacterium]
FMDALAPIKTKSLHKTSLNRMIKRNGIIQVPCQEINHFKKEGPAPSFSLYGDVYGTTVNHLGRAL